MIKDKDPGEAFDAIVSAQRHLAHFREKRADMVLLLDRGLAVLTHMHREAVQVRTASSSYVIKVIFSSLSTRLDSTRLRSLNAFLSSCAIFQRCEDR